MNLHTRSTLLPILLALACTPTLAQSPAQSPDASLWTPGARYREYVWRAPTPGQAGTLAGAEDFLRVGGRVGYARTPGKFPDSLQDGATLLLPDSVILAGARAVTVTIEKVLAHEGTQGLAIALNGRAPLRLPEPADVPAPQGDYMFHTEVALALPLAALREGRGNRFALTVDSAQRWNWPQNIIYAVIFRVYYAPSGADAPEVDYAYRQVPLESLLRVKGVRPGDAAADYVFVGRDADWSGRGQTQRTHWQTYRGEPYRTIGRATAAGSAFAQTWRTEWLPEQTQAFGVQVRVKGGDGVWRVGRALTGLALSPRPETVELVAMDPAPANWVTRADTFAQSFYFAADSLRGVTALQLGWRSWSPCYANGVYLNDHLMWMRDGPCYRYADHELTFTEPHDLLALEAGRNVLRTGMTPRFRGQMVHGMEVQWPGMWVKVRRGASDR